MTKSNKQYIRFFVSVLDAELVQASKLSAPHAPFDIDRIRKKFGERLRRRR